MCTYFLEFAIILVIVVVVQVEFFLQLWCLHLHIDLVLLFHTRSLWLLTLVKRHSHKNLERKKIKFVFENNIFFC